MSAHVFPSTAAKTVLEFYFDYVCPFSAKQYKVIYEQLIPYLKESKTERRIELVFRHQVQPWHPASQLLHEAGLAVSKLNADRFWEFSNKLFIEQKKYFDEFACNESRHQVYKRLAKIATSVGVDEAAFLDLLFIQKASSNDGNKVASDLKTQIKISRQNGIHVSPTVVRDGLADSSISSSYTLDDWKKYLHI